MKWFKHDSNANMDDKLQEVLLDYGLEGYGLYWYCIELITNRVSEDNLTFELKHDARIIARNTGSTVQKVEQMMKSFVKLGLFENSQGTITCFKLAKRLDKSMTSNPEMRRLIGNLKNHDSIMTQSDFIMQEENRLEEIRQEENKEKDLCNLPKSQIPSCPHFEIIKLWGEVLPDKPQPRVWSDARKKHLSARWKDGFKLNKLTESKDYETKEQGLDWWRNFFEFIRSSDFLMNGFNNFDLPWLIQLENFNKIREGKYHK